MTLVVVVALGIGVLGQTEAWPITAYRLFSGVRTGNQVAYELVAVDRDGAARPVRFRGDTVATTAHQFPSLRTLPEAEQREKVRTWLRLADIDPATVTVVRLERVTRRLDPNGGPATETGRRIVVEVHP